MIPLIIIVIELLFIAYMIWDNVTWQQKVLKSYRVGIPKKKIKLNKGQKIIFAEKEDINPFEEIAHANTNS